MTTTAQVETLTAEVRVLMVSNRQITLSVARQLDAFEHEDDEPLNFTPFGRIRTGAKGEKFVPCREGDKGAEWFPLPNNCRRHPNCRHRKLTLNGTQLCSRTERIELREYEYQWIGRHEPTGNLIVVNAFADEIRDDELFCGWTDLPLIVLAGLR